MSNQGPGRGKPGGGLGDGLVPIASALGQHRDETRTRDFPDSHPFVVSGSDQGDLLSDSGIYQQLRDWQSSFETNNPCQGKTRYGPSGMAAAENPKTVPR